MSTFNRTRKYHGKQGAMLKMLDKAKAVATLELQHDTVTIQGLAAARAPLCSPPTPEGKPPAGCHACDPKQDGTCLWRRGILQEEHRPDLWGCRTAAANLTPSGGAPVGVIVMRHVPWPEDAPAPTIAFAEIDFPERPDVRTVASILARRVAGVCLQDACGEPLSWIGTDGGLERLRPPAAPTDVPATCGTCGRGDDVPCDCAVAADLPVAVGAG